MAVSVPNNPWQQIGAPATNNPELNGKPSSWDDGPVRATIPAPVPEDGKNALRRPTRASDNAALGYGAGSLWQHAGKLYTPAGTVDSVAAAWVNVASRGALPGDVLGGAAKCVGGLVALFAGYTGPAITLQATVSGSPVNTVINILAGGRIDSDAIRKVLASADAGTFVYVVGVTDQSGNGNHLTFASTAQITRGFYILWDAQMRYWTLAADQTYSGFAQALAFPASLSVAESSASAYFFGRGLGAQANPNSQVLASFGGTTNAWTIHTGEGAIGVAGWATNPRRPTAGGSVAPLDCRPCVVSMRGAAGSIVYTCNEDAWTWTGTANSTPRTGGFLGNWDLGTGKFPAMRFVGFVVANATATAAQHAAINAWFYSEWGVLPQARDVVAYISDSRGTLVDHVAARGQAGANVGVQLAETLQSDAVVVNLSTSGYTNASHATATVPFMPGLIRPGRKHLAVLLLGVNDFLVLNSTAAQSVAALAANVSTLRAQGWTVWVVAELATVSTTNGAASKTEELRTLIKAGAAGADKVLDVSTLPPVSSPSVAAYYPDGLHPAESVSGVVAAALAPEIDAFLAA